MAKEKQPYIPLYIGDWEQDTNCLTLEAEGALLKIIFKLWKAEKKGVLEFRFNSLSLLLKKSEEITRKIVSELHENAILNIEFIGNDRVKFTSRRMIKDADKSLTNSKNGSKGGRPKKANQNQTKSELKAKTKRIPDNDIDNESDIDNENKKGVRGKNESAIRVMEYFNLATGRSLQVDNKSYLALINARLKEGRVESALCDLIDYKQAEWVGTDYEKHIHPGTLFCTKHAQKYADQVQAAKDKKMTLAQIKGNSGGKIKPTMEGILDIIYNKQQ